MSAYSANQNDDSGTTKTAAHMLPARPLLRKLLNELLRSDSDLEAFCGDYFSAEYRRFTSGMERNQKLTILLDHADSAAILNALRKAYPEAATRIDVAMAGSSQVTADVQAKVATPRSSHGSPNTFRIWVAIGGAMLVAFLAGIVTALLFAGFVMKVFVGSGFVIVIASTGILLVTRHAYLSSAQAALAIGAKVGVYGGVIVATSSSIVLGHAAGDKIDTYFSERRLYPGGTGNLTAQPSASTEPAPSQIDASFIASVEPTHSSDVSPILSAGPAPSQIDASFIASAEPAHSSDVSPILSAGPAPSRVDANTIPSATTKPVQPKGSLSDPPCATNGLRAVLDGLVAKCKGLPGRRSYPFNGCVLTLRVRYENGKFVDKPYFIGETNCSSEQSECLNRCLQDHCVKTTVTVKQESCILKRRLPSGP